jgi:hypothetical protein
MKIFTQVKSFLILATIFSINLKLNAQASPMKLTVNSPAEVAGDYLLVRQTNFGPQDNNEILDQNIKLGNPILACSALPANSLTGFIGFVDRGVCNIIDKVRNAQNAGAIAVVICSDDRDPINASGSGTITVKSFMMEKADCDRIKLALSNSPVNVSIKVRACEPLAPPNTIFGKNTGEGDFNGGFNGWTTSTEEGKGWEWTEDGNCGRGEYIFPECRFGTPTVCNGTVIMDSDYLNFAGICGAPCESSLISPTIDLSNVNVGGLFLQFNQGIRTLSSRYFLMLSYDNGLNWPDTIELNTNIAPNTDFFTNQKVRLPLCTSRTDFDKITLRFHIIGNYYFWGLDDIFLINESLSDPQVNNNFWSTAPNVKTPSSQVTSFPVLSDIKNNGNTNSTNTVLNCKVNKLEGNVLGAEVYNENYNYNTVKACEQIENKVFPKLVNQSDEVGQYVINYTIKSDNNQVTNNDTRTSSFFITENEFSNALSEEEFGATYLEDYLNGVNPAFAFGQSNDPLNFSMGTHYYFPNGSKAKMTTFTFGIDDEELPAASSAAIRCSVYKIIGDNSDSEGFIVPSEYVAVGKGYSEADGGDEMFIDNDNPSLRSLVFQLKSLDDGDLILEDNSGYMFVIHVTAFTGTANLPILGFNPNTSNQTLRWSYTAAMDLAFDSLFIQNPHYGTVTSQNATAVTDPSELDQRTFRSNMPYKMYSSVKFDLVNNTDDNLLSDNAFTIYPNPTSDKLFIDMNLDKTAKDVKVELYSVDGRRVISDSYNNIRTETLKINTNTLISGVYTAKIITNDGTLSKKVIVSK